MIKRIITFTLGVTIIGGSSLSAIGCTQPNFDTKYWIITDGGVVTDHSFHESVYSGANAFIHDVDKGNKVASYIEPPTPTTSQYIISMKIVNTFKAKITVLSGYRFLPLEAQAAKYLTKAVQVDGSTPVMYPNIAYIVYESEISSFFAALADAEYFSNCVPKNAVPLPILSMYGGLPNALTVNRYMWGFLAGMSFWNYIIGNKTVPAGLGPSATNNFRTWQTLLKKTVPDQDWNGHQLRDKTLRSVGMAPTQGKLSNKGAFENFKINSSTPVPPNWFSGSFKSGDAKSISQTLLTNSNSIFPIAGLQIADTVNALKSYTGSDKKYDRLIGVDTAQGQLFGSDVVLTSALKQLGSSTRDVMHGVKGETPGDANNNFLGHTLSSGDPKYYKWNGISPTYGNKGEITESIVKVLEGNHFTNPNIKDLIGALTNLYNKYAISGPNPDNWGENINRTNKAVQPSGASEYNWGEYLIENS